MATTPAKAPAKSPMVKAVPRSPRLSVISRVGSVGDVTSSAMVNL